MKLIKLKFKDLQKIVMDIYSILNHYESSVAFDVVNIHVREDKKCN